MLQYQSCVNNSALKQAYAELKDNVSLPQVFKHSIQTPMPVEMTASLLFIRQKIMKEHENDQQRDILLKAGSLEIIRFVSQLADMYTMQSKDKNKSVNQTLKQENLKLQFADILSEMRHALTHKAIPDKKLIVSSINYIIDYLEKNYWELKLQEQSPILQIRANIKHKLDQVANENDITIDDDYGCYTETQIQIILVFCLDYLMGLADFHVCHKRLKDRKNGEERIKIVSKFIIYLIQHLLNNKNTKHVKRQLARRKYICNDKSFLSLYNKLSVIGNIKQNIREFVLDLEAEIPELKQMKKEIYESDVKQKKLKLIGSLYCDFVNNINDQEL